MADNVSIGFTGVTALVEKPATIDGKMPGVEPSIRHARHDGMTLISIHHADGTTLVACLSDDALHDFTVSIAERIERLPRAHPAHARTLQ